MYIFPHTRYRVIEKSFSPFLFLPDRGGFATFTKAFMGIPAQQAAKNT
jgi:hypothetical protein